MHPVNSDVAENGKLEQVLSNRGLSAFCAFLAASLRSRAALQIEILALRHQLKVLQRSVKRRRLSAVDRWLWVRFSRNWSGWRAALKLLKPATAVGWHYKGFRVFWAWKCVMGGQDDRLSPWKFANSFAG